MTKPKQNILVMIKMVYYGYISDGIDEYQRYHEYDIDVVDDNDVIQVQLYFCYKWFKFDRIYAINTQYI